MPDMNEGPALSALNKMELEAWWLGDLQTHVDLKVFCRCHFFPNQSSPKTPRRSTKL